MPVLHQDPGKSLPQSSRPNRWLAYGTALGAIVVALTFARWSQQKRQMQELIAGRNVIAEQLNTLVYTQGVLEMAARQTDLTPGNRELAACLGHGGSCSITSPSQQVPIAIRMALDPSAPLLVGTPENPAVFGGTGKVGCDQDRDESCPGWIAQAWFWAECPDGATQCTKAKRLHIRHLVSPSQDLAKLPALPDAKQFAQNPSAFTHPVEIKL